MPNRRIFSAGLASALLAGCGQGGGGSNAITPQAAGATAFTTLRAMAEDKNMYFGAAVQSSLLSSVPAYAAAFAADCGVLVPETELKWAVLESTHGKLNTAPADSIIDFAASKKMRTRGHTLTWYGNIPQWMSDRLVSDPKAVDLLYAHIDQVVGLYKGKLFEWDVVNEAVEPNDGLPNGLRNSIYMQTAGVEHIANSFFRAHAADPSARLFYNEYGLEYDTAYATSRRRATLDLLTDLKARGVPVHALGTQTHLKTGSRFNATQYANFLSDVASLGLKIVLTEFDVDDSSLAADVASRDQQVAEHARQVLDVAFAQPAVIGLMTWGMTDAYTWLNSFRARADGQKHRALPLDDAYQKKALWTAIADSFTATMRRPTAP